MTRTFTHLFAIASLPAAAALLGGCGAGGAGGAEQAPPRERVQPVEVTAVSHRDLTETLLVVGSVAANESTEIRAEISGIVRKIHFQEGAQVKEDEILVQLDDREVQADLREANARLELARQTLARSEALVAQQSVSLADRDRAQADFEQAQAEIDSLKVRLDRTVVRAPFTGVIGARTISPGDLIGPSDQIARLEDLSVLKVEFALPDRHAPGSQILLSSGRAPNTTVFPGDIYFISPVIDRSTRSIQVKAYADNPPESLRPGMFIQVEVVLEKREGVLTVPETAILAREGAHFVILVDKNENGQEVAAYRPVRLGLRQKGLVEVIPLGEPALSGGDTVVAAGVGALPLFPGARLESRPLRASLKGMDRT